MSAEPAITPTPVDPARLAGLRRYNIIVGIILIAQAVAVVALSNDFTLPVTASYLEGPPGTPPGDPVTLLNTPIGLAVAAFLSLSGLALLIVATVWSRGYAADLSRQRNRARWVEYARADRPDHRADGRRRPRRDLRRERVDDPVRLAAGGLRAAR
jgi:hypothetical protein